MLQHVRVGFLTSWVAVRYPRRDGGIMRTSLVLVGAVVIAGCFGGANVAQSPAAQTPALGASRPVATMSGTVSMPIASAEMPAPAAPVMHLDGLPAAPWAGDRIASAVVPDALIASWR